MQRRLNTLAGAANVAGIVRNALMIKLMKIFAVVVTRLISSVASAIRSENVKVVVNSHSATTVPLDSHAATMLISVEFVISTAQTVIYAKSIVAMIYGGSKMLVRSRH